MPRESALTRSIMTYCEKEGCYPVKIHGSLFSKGGMPDLVVLVPVTYQDWAVPCFIEVKQPGQTPDDRQLKRLRELEKAGAVAIWASHLDTVKSAIASIKLGAIE